MATNQTESAATLSVAVAEEIRVWMTRRRMSGERLARELDVSPAWISYRINGQVDIKLGELEKIAKALEVEVSALLPAPVRGNMLPSSPMPARTTSTRLLSAGCPDKVIPWQPNGRPDSPDYRQPTEASDDRRPAAGRSRRPIWRHERVTA